MTRNNISTRFVLPLAVVVAIGLFSLGISSQVNSGRESATTYRTTDLHDRVDLAQFFGARAVSANGLTDAHDRAGSAQQYGIAVSATGLSDLSDRHTAEELRALFAK